MNMYFLTRQVLSTEGAFIGLVVEVDVMQAGGKG